MDEDHTLRNSGGKKFLVGGFTVSFKQNADFEGKPFVSL